MTPEERERLSVLCTKIQDEKNYRRYEELVRDLNSLITKKEKRFSEAAAEHTASKRFEGITTDIIKPALPGMAEKAEISIPKAEDLFREIRIDNSFNDDTGQTFNLKVGTSVNITGG